MLRKHYQINEKANILNLKNIKMKKNFVGWKNLQYSVLLININSNLIIYGFYFK